MKSNSGFGLLELMVAIAIIGMVMATIVPNYQRRIPRVQRENFINSLDNLSQFARQHALTTRKVHKVVFDIANRRAWVEQLITGKKDVTGEPLFAPIKSASVRAVCTWETHFVFRNFLIEGVDELSRGGKVTEEVWFFIVPDGLAQEVIINIADTKDTINNRARQIGLVLNPFTAQYKVYDEYQK
jgi:prepilin-type N-terminal cleavage/methylation domain-containing protein